MLPMFYKACFLGDLNDFYYLEILSTFVSRSKFTLNFGISLNRINVCGTFFPIPFELLENVTDEIYIILPLWIQRFEGIMW